MLDFGVLIVIFLMTVTLHEVAHGFVAYLRGDDTALKQGRLTLNPFRHIDWFWTVLFPAFLLFVTAGRYAIGMAKPVPVNFLNLKRPRLDMALVSLAGPAANLLFGWVLAALFHATEFSVLLYGVYFNIGLAFFNLIPIPPLDGSRVLATALPKPFVRVLDQIEPFGFFVILLLYMTGNLLPLIMLPVNVFVELFHLPYPVQP